MKNLFKKIIASFMCFSLLTLQATFAESTFAAGKDILSPVDGQGGASIKDHTDGLYGVSSDGNNAVLDFNKDTVINWNILNVLKGQKLDFNNGSYAVLNNVLNGMSTFAGHITGDTGAIIIANPNGMIMNGGSIETSGALILTTQDLYTKYHSFFNETNGIDKNALQELLKDPQFKDNTYSIISINNGLNGKISASDINIIAKGIDLNSANITGSGNITFTTSDGANFMAASKDASKTNNIAFNYGDSIQIANSSIKANDGTGSITLIAGKGDNKSNISVNGSILTGNTNIEGLKIGFNENKNSNTSVQGDLTIKSDGATGLFNTSVSNKADITSNKGKIYLSNLTADSLKTNSHTYTNLINSTITNGVEATAGTALVGQNGSTDVPYASFVMRDSKVGSLDVTTKKGAIQLNGGEVVGNAKLTANTDKDSTPNGNIIIGYSSVTPDQIGDAYKNSTKIGGNIELSSTSWVEANSDGNLLFINPEVGDYFHVNGNNVGVEGGYIHGDAVVNALHQVVINGKQTDSTTIDGDLVVAGVDQIGIFNTDVTGLADITSSGSYLFLSNLEADSLKTNSHTYTNLINSTITNGVEATAGTALVGQNGSTDVPYASFVMRDSKVGSLDVTTENGAIQLNGGEVVGNAKLTAGTANSSTPNGNIIIGYSSVTPDQIGDAYKNSTKIGGNIEVSSTSWVEANSNGNLVFINPEVGDYFHVNGKNVAVEGGYIHGDAVVNALHQVVINGKQTDSTTIDGDLVVAGVDQIGIFNTDVTGLADITSSGSYLFLSNLEADSLKTNSHTYTNLINSTITNGVEATAGTALVGQNGSTDVPYASFVMRDSKVGSLDVTTKKGAIQLNGGEVVGNAKLTANTDKDSTPNGNIIIGYRSTTPDQIGDAYKNSTKIGGNIEVSSTSWTKAYSEDNLNFTKADVNDDFIAESKNGHVSVKNADVEGNADFTAKNGVKIWFSDFAKDLTAKFTGDHSVGVPSDAMQTDPPHDVYIAYSNVHGNAKLTASNASDAQITVSNTTIDNNLDAKSAGSVALWQANVGKHVNAKADNGSVSLSGLDKRTEVGSLTANAKQNIIINNSDIKGNANLKSGLDVKSTNSNLIGDTKVEARNASFTGAEERLNIIHSNVSGNLTAESKGNIHLWESTVGKLFKATSKEGEVRIGGSDNKKTTLGSADLNGKTGVTIWDTNISNNATMNAGENSHISISDSSINGTTKLNAQTGNINSKNSSFGEYITANAKNATFKDSKGDLKFYNTNIENKLSANTDGNISLDSNANNVNEALMNKIGSIDFKTENGNINIWDTNVSNDTKLTSENGKILLADSYTKTANITNNQGNISVSNVKADVVNTTHKLRGETVISSKGNKINELNSVATGEAKITLNNANVGNANLSSQKGNITINSTTADNISASNKNDGKISMMYSNIKELFQAKTEKGDIVLDADTAKMNQTVGSLDLKTEDGNINIWDTKVTNTAKLNAKNGNILSSNANYGGNITADAKNAIFDSSKAGKLNFVDSNITGNLKATADNKVALNNSTVGGKFTGKSNNYETTVNHSTVGSAELTSKWNNSFNNSTSNGDIKMSSEGGHSTINASTIKGSAELTAKGNAAINGSTVDGYATVKATDGKASIWESIVGKKATVTSENYEAAIGAGEGKTSQVGSAEITSKYNNRLYNTTVNESAKLTSTNGHSSVSNATIKGNAELTAKGNAAINGSTVDGDATVKATDGKASIWESIVGKKATVTSENYEAAIGASEGKTSQVGSAEIKSKWNNRLYNTTVNGDAKLTSTNGNSSVSNATIKGNAELTAKVSAAVSDSNIESNATVQSETGKASIYKSSVTGIAKVTSSKNEVAIGESQVGTADMYGETGARFYNSKSNGELKIKANTGDVNITNATVRNVNATSHKANINVKNTETTGESRNHFTAKNGNVTSTNSNYIGSIKAEVGKTADFNTDKNITFDYVSADKLNVVSNNENIGIIGNIIADKINLTATNGSIYATTNALLDGNTYNLKALNQIASLDDISDVMNKTDYDWSLQNAINIVGGTVETLSAGIASVHSNGNVTFVTPETTKGNLRLSSDGDLKINKGANVAGNLLTQADGSITTSGNIMAGFDVKAYATDDINIENVNAGRNLELKSNKGNINLGNDSKASSVSGKTTLTADKDINVKNYTSTDSFNATSNNGAITLNKASVGNRAIPAGQYKGITLNAKKDITVNNSYSHGKFIANSTQGSVSVGNTGVETQGSDITAGKDVNLNQFHSAAHVNITAGENVNAKAIGTSANQSIWTVKAGKDANFENLNLNNKNGGLKVEANNININNAPSVGIKQPNVQGQVDLNAKNDIKIENGTEFGSKLNATAGNNISLDRKGDLTINNSSPISLKAGNTVSVSTDGQLVIDNLTSNDIVNGTNVNFAGANITTNNSTYHTNVGMDSKGDVTFTGSNTINGDLTISASKDSGFVAINGDSTKANNITVNGAQYIEANNVETGHLQFNDFEIGHILNTTADSTGFTNGNDLYVNVLNTIINSGELRPSITGSAIDVDRIIFYPTFPEGGDGTNLDGLDEDSALILGYLRDKAIETKLGSDFAPIGFAAHEGRRGGLHRMDIGDSVYRALQEQIDTLHITDRFNIDQ